MKPAIKVFRSELQAKCPNYHSDVPYFLGTMHYAQDKFAEAAKAFEAFRKFPSDDPPSMSKDYDKNTPMWKRDAGAAVLCGLLQEHRTAEPQSW
jgi:hypothetical protein